MYVVFLRIKDLTEMNVLGKLLVKLPLNILEAYV